MEMNEELKKAQILVEALPYIQKFNRKIIVVKYGGSAMVDEELKKKVIQDLSLLSFTAAERKSVSGYQRQVEILSLSMAYVLLMNLQWKLLKWY